MPCAQAEATRQPRVCKPEVGPGTGGLARAFAACPSPPHPPFLVACRYGNLPPASVFVERKTHKESWKGEESVKERFVINEDKVVAFIDGGCVWHVGHVGHAPHTPFTRLACVVSSFHKGRGTPTTATSMFKRGIMRILRSSLPCHNPVRLTLHARAQPCPSPLNQRHR